MLFLMVFIFGAVVGSFLNVCIYRLPKNESIAWPGSHCAVCSKPVLWHDNIPILSYFILKGRCRQCKAPFSFQYPAVEFLTACIFLLFFMTFGMTPKGFVYLYLCLALVVESAIDFRHQIIPDAITLSGMVLGLALSVVFPELQNASSAGAGFLYSLAGLLAGGGFLYVSATMAEWVLKKEAMGGGDVKLLAMIGAFLGWPGVLWTVFVSSVLGSIVGLYLRLKNGQVYIPFGPYLAMAAVLYLFFGKQVISLYLQSLGFGPATDGM